MVSSCADWRLRGRKVKPALAIHPQRVQPRVQEHHWCAPRPPGMTCVSEQDKPDSSLPPQVSSSPPDRSRWTARRSKRRSGTQVPPPAPLPAPAQHSPTQPAAFFGILLNEVVANTWRAAVRVQPGRNGIGRSPARESPRLPHPSPHGARNLKRCGRVHSQRVAAPPQRASSTVD